MLKTLKKRAGSLSPQEVAERAGVIIQAIEMKRKVTMYKSLVEKVANMKRKVIPARGE